MKRLHIKFPLPFKVVSDRTVEFDLYCKVDGSPSVPGLELPNVSINIDNAGSFPPVALENIRHAAEHAAVTAAFRAAVFEAVSFEIEEDMPEKW